MGNALREVKGKYYLDTAGTLNVVYTEDGTDMYILVVDDEYPEYSNYKAIDTTKVIDEEKAKRVYPEFFV